MEHAVSRADIRGPAAGSVNFYHTRSATDCHVTGVLEE